jgi:hypothetical protein
VVHTLADEWRAATVRAAVAIRSERADTAAQKLALELVALPRRRRCRLHCNRFVETTPHPPGLTK